MITFDKIVKKMGKKGGKIMFKKDIFDIIDPEKKPENQNKLDKYIYRLKSDGVILPLKSGVYIVPDDEEKKLNRIDLLEKYYLQLLKKYITFYAGNQYYISGKKSLELHMKNNEVPEKIYITNRNVSKKISVGNYEIIFKTIQGTDISGKKINLYSKLSAFTTKKQIESIEFKIAGLELALLEGSLLADIESGLDIKLLNKVLKKYSTVFDTEIFYDIGQYKYIMSFNRLKELVKHIDTDLYKIFLDIIKKNGGLFIGEGLRGF